MYPVNTFFQKFKPLSATKLFRMMNEVNVTNHFETLHRRRKNSFLLIR